MPSELEQLTAKAEELSRSVFDRPEAARAGQLVERLRAGQFVIAVVGEFKRGKSTLVNALLGEAVLPTGALPLTAVATELAFGEPGAVVEFADGHAEAVPRDEIAIYATEAGNPTNERHVARIEVRGRWSLLEPGVVLVDTPGIASLYAHNSEAGQAALLAADGAILVFSADTPMSEREAHLLQLLHGRGTRTFFVINKADHLEPGDLVTVRQFVSRSIAEVLGTIEPVHVTDARSALAAASASRPVRSAGIEFVNLRAEISRFIEDDLVAARVVATRNELSRLGHALSEAVNIERAARGIAAGELVQLVDRFGHEAERQRQGFEDDRTLLGRDVAALLGDAGDRLAQFARVSPSRHLDSLAGIAASASRSSIVDDLRLGVEEAVQGAFDAFRRDELILVEEGWNQLAARFRDRVQRRVDAARQAGADLFAVPLPRLEIPHLAAQRDRFSFLFLHVGSATEPLSRAAARIVPSRWARRRALARAEQELVAEFDKHAGRARWDLAQRLEAARLDLDKAMRTALDESVEGIIEAADRARTWHARAEEDRDREDEQARTLERLATELAALGQGVG